MSPRPWTLDSTARLILLGSVPLPLMGRGYGWNERTR
jgi:hypothetical protein